MILRWLFLSVILLYPLVVSSQSVVQYSSYWDNYLIRNLTMDEDGLPSETVFYANQSSDGFVWIVCATGLVRFDGISSKVFHANNSAYNGSTLYEVQEDSKGNLWLPTIGEGIMRFSNETFTHFGLETGLSTDLVKSLAVAQGDTLWLGTYGGGLQAFYGDTVVASYSTENGLVHDQVWRVIVDRENRVWVGTNGGLSILENGTFTNYTTENGLPFNVIRGLTEMENGEVWVGTDREGIIVFKDQKPVKYYNTSNGLSDRDPQFFAQNPEDGSIWIAYHGNGVDRFYDGKFEPLTTDHGLISGFTTSVNFTKEGLALIGSESGVSILQKRKIDVINTKQGLSENLLINVNQDSSGIIWAGTDGKGFNYKKDGKWQVIEYPPNFTNGYASGASVDRQGNIWFNSKGTGTVKIENYSVVKSFTEADGLASNFARGIAFDHHNNAWIGTNEGISIINALGEIQPFEPEGGLPHNFMMSAISASDSSIWMASFGGGALRIKNGELTVFDTTNGLLTNKVFALLEDKNNNIWMSGSFGGLSLYDGENISSFNMTDGLPSEGFNALIEDDFGNLWLGTGNGIFKVNMQDIFDYNEKKIASIPFTRYTTEDGFPSQTLQIGYNSTVTKLDNGNILFTTNDGIAVINPENMSEPAPEIRTYIDQLLLDGKKVNLKEELVFQPESKKLEITYSAFNFKAPSKTKFRVKLSGVDSDWVEMGNRKTVYYDFLPDGDYTFEVAATNADGQWKYKTAGLNFRVLPPFYKRWWFIATLLTMFGGVIAGSIRLRYRLKMRDLNRELAIQQKIQAERERISRDLHDNVGSQITNLITGLEISNLHISKNQRKEALNVIQSLNTDARGAMTELRETIWLLDRDIVKVTEFTDHLKGFIKRQAYSLNGLNISLKNEVPSEMELNPMQSLHLLRIIQEAINNCRKYSYADKLEIKLYYSKNMLKVILSDDGKGMEMKKVSGNGNGIKNMRRRAKEMNGLCSIQSQPGNGTTIIVKIPIIP